LTPKSLNSEQLVHDAVALTNHLRACFGRNKTYLLCRSGGTFFGIQAVARAPALCRAWITVMQISNQLASEQLAHRYMLQRDSGTARHGRGKRQDGKTPRRATRRRHGAAAGCLNEGARCGGL